MAFSLDSISTNTQVKPPICLFHGVPGVGKTTFASDAPDVIFIRTEDGLGINQVDAFPIAESFDDVLSALDSLVLQKHSYAWLAIDTLSALQSLIFASVCADNEVPSIEKISYGKGYVYALDKWQLLLNYITHLRDTNNMGIALIAHTEVQTFQNPEGENYDRYHIALDKRAVKLFQERSDIIGFCNYRTYTTKSDDDKKAKGVDGGRMLYLREKPAFVAKNRYRLPDEIAIPDGGSPWSNFQDALLASITGNQAA